jgi:hypothetical protein
MGPGLLCLPGTIAGSGRPKGDTGAEQGAPPFGGHGTRGSRVRLVVVCHRPPHTRLLPFPALAPLVDLILGSDLVKFHSNFCR